MDFQVAAQEARYEVWAWAITIYLLLAVLCGVIALFDAWDKENDKQTAKLWAYFSFLVPVIGLIAYFVVRSRNRTSMRNRTFCPSCGTYFDGAPVTCVSCGSSLRHRPNLRR